MRIKNRIISFVLTAAMLLSLLPATVLAGEYQESDFVATVYVDGVNGANTATNDGSTPEKAKKGMTYAYQALYKAMGDKKDDPTAVGRIIVLNDVSFSSSAGPTPNSTATSSYAEFHDCTVYVTSKTGAEALVMKNNYINLGPTVYENITLTKADGAGTYTFFCANGYPLVIGEGVTCEPNDDGSYMSLMGGVLLPEGSDKLTDAAKTGATADSGKAFTGDTSLTVKSGTWRNIYTGPYKGTQTGNAVLNMSGGTVTYKTGAAFSGTLNGNFTANITGGELQGNLYAGGTDSDGKVTGNTTITLENAKISKGTLAGTLSGGGVSGTVSYTIKDSSIAGDVSGADTLNLTASQGKTLSISGGKLEADTFTGGGTLVLGESASLKADAVTGKTTWKIDGEPCNVNYITAPAATADDAFTYVASGAESQIISTADGVKRFGITGGKDVVALKLTVPQAVTLTLYTGFSTEGAKVSPDMTSTEDGITTYTYNNLAAGNYCYAAKGTGYYNIKKNIYYSEAEAKAGQTVDCNPGLKAGNGFEQTSQIGIHTDEVLNTILNSDPTQEAWKDYAHIFTTPVFAEGRPEQQQTTQEELLAFLDKLDDEDDNMYSYTIGYTPVYNYATPIAVFTTTDLSGAETLEEAAELVKANGKPIVHYQGLIHANESSGGEAALAMIQSLDGAYGDDVLEKVNVYVIPRFNGDGADVYQRANVAQGIDMNRDHMYVQSKEVENVHKVYNMFLPHVTIDGHEFTSSTTGTSSTLDDVQVGTAGNLNSGADFTKYSQAIVQETFKAARSLGLRPYNYGEYASTVNNAIGRPYYALYGSLSFLIETRGIGSGLAWMERRVISQYVVAETIINYVADNADTIKKTSDTERQRLVELGAVYGEENDVLVLEHGVTKNSYYEIDRPSWNLTDGSLKSEGTGKKVYYFDKIISSRERPTAYVIDKGESWVEQAIAIMDKNGIEYYEVEAGSAILLQQYKGTKAAATVTDEQVVTFKNGAYVFPMDQIGANVLAMTMEPDVVDSEGYNGTLLQSKIVAPDSNGMIPIYRHIRNLVDGEVSLVELPAAPEGLEVIQPAEEFGTGAITGLDAAKAYEYRAENESEYTAVPAGATQIPDLTIGTYYVRYPANATTLASKDAELEVIDGNISEYVIYVSKNGDDSADGRTEANAVATMTAAYERLEIIMRHAPEGTEGIIKFLTTITFSEDVTLPAHDFPVVLTSATGAEGLSSGKNIAFSGDTRLDDMTLTLTADALHYISANGNKLEIGENVNTVPSGSYYYCIAGGGNSNSVVGDTELIINSGSFRNVYAAGYKGTVKGNVTLTMNGGTVTGVVQSSYSGAVTGDVVMNLTGAKIGSLYGGNTNSGDVNGNVAILLGEGTTVGDVYAGSRDAGSVNGSVCITLDGAVVTGRISGGCKNATGTVQDSTVILASGTVPANVTADTIILDTAEGKTLTLPGSIVADLADGDGTVVLPADATITVEEAVGTTTVVIDGEVSEEIWYISTPESVSDKAFACTVEGKAFNTKVEEGRKYWYIGDPVNKTLKFTVALDEFDNGTVALSNKAAAAGDTVTLTVKADEGYELTALTVTDSNGNAVKVTKAADGKYTFVMPNKAVAIAPVFAESDGTETCPAEQFDDVDTDLWYHDAVDFVVENGLMTGVADDAFAPNATTTRGMIVTILYSLEGKPAASGDAFDDVNEGDWYFNAANWAAANGIVSGYGDGKFGPNDNVTREQLVAILKAYAVYKGVDVSVGENTNILSYSDFDQISEWAIPAVQWGCGAGIISGKSIDTLDPAGNALRCEVAQMMMKFVGLL